MIKNQRWSTYIDDEKVIPFDQSLGQAILTCQLPAQNLSMAIAGSNQCFAEPHPVYNMLNRRIGNDTSARLGKDTNHNLNQRPNNQIVNDNRRARDNDNAHRGNGNNNGNGNGNGNGNHRNVRQRQEGAGMTDERRAELKDQGFLQ